MRAALLEAPNQPLVIVDDVELASPQVGEVRVRVHHCGLCHSDLHFIDGSLPGSLPLLLGHEAGGIVEEVGPGVTDLVAGDKVILTLKAACGRCYFCVRGEQQLCAVGGALSTGFFPDGTTRLSRGGATVHRSGVVLAAFAEETVVPASAAVKVPADTPLDVASVIGCSVQTGVGAALNTARVETGATVMVVGLGGIGISVVQGARLAGASRIIGVDPNESRREQAMQFGCTDVVDPNQAAPADVAKEMTAGIGVDYAFECVGRSALVESCLSAIRPGGTTVMIGVPKIDDRVSVLSIDHAMREKKLIGCFLGSSKPHYEFGRLLALWEAGKLDLDAMITSRRPLADINLAVADMQAGIGLRTVLDCSA
ncbi:MAG TPA: Zn-dependent alcohol dehydrogenase [Acidimicrobiales bacterium]